MKKKIIGLLVCMLLIATALPAVGTINEKEIPMGSRIDKNSLNHLRTPRTTMSSSRGGIYLQLPVDPADPWGGPFSDLQHGYRVYDDFYEVTGPICDVQWWGFGVVWNGTTWIPCDPEGMKFNITFYEDDGSGKPGTVVWSYVDITPSITPIGIYYETPSGVLLELYFFDSESGICNVLSDGWVSIVKTYSPNDGIFAWMDSYDGNTQYWQQNLSSGLWHSFNPDVAFILVDNEPNTPELKCDGSLSWNDIKPGTSVTGDFVIGNNGDNCSVLHWDISKYPNWGSNWTFTPNVGILTPEADWITVNVSAVAPDDPNEEFTGKIMVVNSIDPSDCCVIDVILITPKNKPFNINPLFLRFLENQPPMFPMLRYLLGL